MSEKVDYSSFMLGVFFGMVLVFAIAASPWSVATKANSALTHCQKELPRNQKCEVTATVMEQSK